MREAVIVAGARTPIGRAKKGSLANTRSDDFGAVVVKETLKRAGYEGPIDDLIMGCAMPEAEQGMNVARLVGALAGLPDETPALTVNRFCSSGLQTIAYAAERIMLGHAKAIIAGGTESMSMIPMTGNTVRLNSKSAEEAPQYYIGMGHTAEEVANRYNVSREDQDAFAVRSHALAEKAIKEGKFKDEIVPVEVTEYYVDENNKLQEKKTIFDTDEGVRPGTSVEGLAKLRPAFNVKGSVTAGNASQTSDGAAAVLVMDREEAEKQGMKPLAKFLSFAVGGVPPEVMGIGPIVAVPKALEIAEFFVYPNQDTLLIERPEKFGGNLELTKDELYTMYGEGNLHPMDLEKSQAMAAEHEAYENKIAELMEKWELLMEALEE